MGGQEQSEVNVPKADSQVRGFKSESEDLLETYKSLKIKVEGNKRSIVGLTTEMEEVRKRIRLLNNKRVAAAGPDYDEYKINRKVTKTYEPVDVTSKSRRSITSSSSHVSTEDGVVVEESSTITVSEEVIEEWRVTFTREGRSCFDEPWLRYTSQFM